MDSSGGILPADLDDPNLIVGTSHSLMLTVTLTASDTAAVIKSVATTSARLLYDMASSRIVLAKFYPKRGEVRLLPCSEGRVRET